MQGPCSRSDGILRAALSSLWWVLHMPSAVAVVNLCCLLASESLRVTRVSVAIQTNRYEIFSNARKNCYVRVGREIEEEPSAGWVRNEAWCKQLGSGRKRLGLLLWEGFFCVWEFLVLWRIKTLLWCLSHNKKDSTATVVLWAPHLYTVRIKVDHSAELAFRAETHRRWF